MKSRAIVLAILLTAAVILLLNKAGIIQRSYAQNSTATATTVSAASYAPIVAPEEIVAAFGTNMAATTRQAEDADPSQAGIQLPTLLGGASVEVNGRSAGMFFVSPGQINFQVPPGLEPGTGYVIVRNDRGVIVAAGDIQIVPAAPAIFTANGFGNGAPAGIVIRVKPDGQQIYDSLSVFDPRSGAIVPRPIDLGADGDRIFLAIYITGARRVNNPNDTRVLIGGQELRPLFVGPSPEFVGVEQVNFELPRTLRGRLTFVFAAIGYPTSNPCELEIAPPSDAPPRIVALNKSSVLAGESIEITGSGFSAVPAENAVSVVDKDHKEFNAQIQEASATRLKVMIPYGAGSGGIAVQTARGRIEYPFTMRTSVSGIVQTAQLQPNGEYKRVGVRGVTVRTSTISTTTNDDGSFLLPGVPPSSRATIEIDARNSTLNFDKELVSLRVTDARDNQYQGYIELKPIGGTNIPTLTEGVLPQSAFTTPASATPAENELTGQTGQVTFEPNGSTATFPDGTRVNSINVTVLDPGRTPVDLPARQFSSTIVQLTPFGARINPGGKLTFPNTDGLAAGETATLFRFDQTPGSNTLGQFVPAGSATVTADGQRIETARDAVKESTYYFVSVPRPITTIYGSVVEEDSTPARGALVQVRGQSIFALTDQNGAFILPNVPIVGANELTLEISYLRPDSTVDRTERSGVKPNLNALTFVSPPIVLPGKGRTRAPVILAPKTLAIEAGKNSEFGFIAYARVAGQSLRSVTVAGASFATVTPNGNDRYTLRLTPAANVTGTFTLTLRAEDSQSLVTTETIALEVRTPNNPAPVANSQSVTTDEDTPVAITLTGSNGNVYRITSPPRFGSLSGNAPNLVYAPAKDFNGADSFSFTVSNGQMESSPATVAIAVRAVNDAPRLEVGTTYATNIGQQLNFVINGTDVDAGQKLTLTSTGLPSGATITQTTATSWLFSWTPNFDQLGNYTLNLTLRDDGSPMLSDNRVITLGVDAKWAKTSQIAPGSVKALTVLGNTLFAGTLEGGVYRTTDNGVSWTAVNNGLGSLIVNDFAVKGNTLFAATAQGGIYRTTDNGSSWIAVNNGLGDLTVVTLAVKDNLLFAGTQIRGVYRTSDDGGNWTAVNTGLGSGSSTFNTYALTVKDDAVFAAASFFGVYRTTNNGASWTRVNNGLETSVNALTVKDGIVFAGTFGGAVYQTKDNGTNWTLAAQLGGSGQRVNAFVSSGNALVAGLDGGGVYRTADNGATWTAINDGLGDLKVFALTAKDNALFAGTINGGAYRRAENSTSWTAVSSGLSERIVNSLAVKDGAIFVGGIAVSRSADNGASWTLANSGLEGFSVLSLAVKGNAVFAGSNGVYRTTNNGASWVPARNGLGIFLVYSLAVRDNTLFAGTLGGGVYRSVDDGANWQRIHNDLLNQATIRALATKDNLLFAGGTGGAYRTADNDTSWTRINNGLENQPVLAFALKDNALFAGTARGIYRTTDNGANWVATNNGLGTPPVYALTIKEGALFAGTFGGEVYRSVDNGLSWTLINKGLSARPVNALTPKENALFAGTSAGVYFLAESATTWTESNLGLALRDINTATANGGGFLVGTFGGGVFYSPDKGQSWSPANTGLPPAADVRAFTPSGNGVLAGLAGEGVYFSNDQGRNWTARNAGLTNKLVNALARDGATVYAGTNGGVFRSGDGGANWTVVNTGLTRSQVLSLAVSSGAVYAGTDNGLFRSTNQGASWTEVSTGLNDRYIVSLGVAPNGTTLLAGTSSGLFRASSLGNQVPSWTPVTSGVPERVVALTFVQKGTKLLMGSVNGFFVSEDNGASFRQINGGLLTLQVGALAVSGDTVLAGTRSGGVFVSQLP